MEFYIAIELAVFIGHEGQIEMNSKLEMRLLSRLVEYVKESNLTRLEHALAYIYLKSWGPNAKERFYSNGHDLIIWLSLSISLSTYLNISKPTKHVLETNCLEFSKEDFHGALIMISYPMESQMNDDMKHVKTLVLDRFSNDIDKFNSWSNKL